MLLPHQNITAVVPFYNEVENAEALISEIQGVLSQFSNPAIIAVDDGSSDGTYERLRAFQSQLPWLTVVKHARNYGQSAAVLSGVRAARSEWVVTLDGDGQNDPADIPKLCAALGAQSQQKVVLIVGHRVKRNDTWLRRISTIIANAIRGWLLKDNCPDTGCGLKLFRREDFLKLPHFNHVHRFLPALFKRAGGQVLNVPVNHRARLRGQSKYGVMNRLWVGIVDLIGVSWLMRRPCAPESESFSAPDKQEL